MKLTTDVIAAIPAIPAKVSITITLNSNEAAILAVCLARQAPVPTLLDYEQRGNYEGVADYVTDRVEATHFIHAIFGDIIAALKGNI